MDNVLNLEKDTHVWIVRANQSIDKEGIIRYIEVLNSPGDMPDNEDLFDALRKL